jgi:hypothetical protein
VVSGDETYNNCDVSDEELPTGDPEGFTLAVNGPDSVTWTFDSTGDTTTCSLDGAQGFTCTRMNGEEQVPDFNIYIGSNIDIVGEYRSQTALTSTWDVEVSCTRGDCYLLDLVGISLPCTFGMTVEATKD